MTGAAAIVAGYIGKAERALEEAPNDSWIAASLRSSR